MPKITTSLSKGGRHGKQLVMGRKIEMTVADVERIKADHDGLKAQIEDPAFRKRHGEVTIDWIDNAAHHQSVVGQIAEANGMQLKPNNMASELEEFYKSDTGKKHMDI